MTLAEWIEGQPLGAIQDLAKRARTTRQTIHRIAHGLVAPRADTAIRIERATGGRVSAAEMLGLRR